MLKVRKIEVPSDLTERMDANAGSPKGTLLEILTEGGQLHEVEQITLAIALGKVFAHLVEDKDMGKVIPGASKAMSVERFSSVAYALLTSYMLGTVKFDENGDAILGTSSDIEYVKQIQKEERIELANGRQVLTDKLMFTIQKMTDEDTLKNIYNEIVGKGLRKHKQLKPVDAVTLVKAILQGGDEMAEVI